MSEPIKRTRLSVYGVAVRNGRILMIRLAPHVPSGGKWSLPGGGVDWGETLEEALHREFLEETGLTCEQGDLALEFGFTTEKGGDDLFVHQVVFAVKASVGEPSVLEVEGSTEHVEWVSFESAKNLPLVPMTQLAFEWAKNRN